MLKQKKNLTSDFSAALYMTSFHQNSSVLLLLLFLQPTLIHTSI